MNGWVKQRDLRPAFDYPEIKELMQKNRGVAPANGIDPLGVPFVRAEMRRQVLWQAVEATKSLDYPYEGSSSRKLTHRPPASQPAGGGW